MPAKKTSVSLYDEERRWLQRHGGVSRQFHQDLATLQGLVEMARRRVWTALSEGERTLLRHAIAGSVYEPAYLRETPYRLAGAVEDAALDRPGGQEWQCDPAALAERLRGLHPADAWALWEIAQWDESPTS